VLVLAKSTYGLGGLIAISEKRSMEPGGIEEQLELGEKISLSKGKAM